MCVDICHGSHSPRVRLLIHGHTPSGWLAGFTPRLSDWVGDGHMMKDGKSEVPLGVRSEQMGKDSCPSLREAKEEVSLEMPPLGKHLSE